jgi:hypothetical protein
LPIELVLAIVVIVVMMCVWIWLNLRWIQSTTKGAVRGRQQPATNRSNDAKAVEARQQDTQDDTHDVQGESGVFAETSDAPSVSHASMTGENEASESMTNSGSIHSEDDGDSEQTPPVEVIAPEPHKGSKVFEREPYPFRLYGTTVSAFAEERWLRCFHRLTEDEGVLGWIAFHEDTVGASDREYDQKFVDSLMTYRKTLEEIQKEVGFSHILETSIVGEEGKMWFLSAVDDVWLALFVERTVDVEQLSQRLLTRGSSSSVDEQEGVLS